MGHTYKFIVNPAAGRGRAKTLEPVIRKKFKEAKAEFDIYFTKGPNDAIEAAQNAVKDGFDVVVAVGGDGTVNEVANGLVGSDAILAALPGGTGNDFVIANNIPRKSIEEACDVLLKGKIKAIDLGMVLNRHFVNAVGVGFDAAVAHRKNTSFQFLTGYWAYTYALFTTLVSYKATYVKIEMDGVALERRVTLIAVGIGATYGGGMKILPDAVQDDGFFDICVLDEMHPACLVYNFPKVFSGKHTKIKQASMHRAKRVQIIAERTIPLHMEGEVLFGDKMEFTLQEKGIKVLGNW